MEQTVWTRFENILVVYGLMYNTDDVKMLYLDKNIMEILTADHRAHYETIYNNNAQVMPF